MSKKFTKGRNSDSQKHEKMLNPKDDDGNANLYNKIN